MAKRRIPDQIPEIWEAEAVFVRHPDAARRLKLAFDLILQFAAGTPDKGHRVGSPEVNGAPEQESVIPSDE